MKQINFTGIEPTDLVNEIAEKVKAALAEDLKKITDANKPETYLSADKLCLIFDISKATIHAWSKRKILKPIRLGARVYYRLSDIEIAMRINS